MTRDRHPGRGHLQEVGGCTALEPTSYALGTTTRSLFVQGEAGKPGKAGERGLPGPQVKPHLS